MQEEQTKPNIDFCTWMQISEIMTATYLYTPLNYQNKLSAGMDYRRLIKQGRV